jgi:CheY-like chemotaxis protein
MNRRSPSNDSTGDRERVPRTARLVLLVDDHDDIREMLAELLSFAGFETAEAKTGKEALVKARELRPDVVVTDLRLPEIDGWDLTRRVREDTALEATRVIVLSGSAEGGAEGRARDAGCDGFLVKPCTPDLLVAEIRRVLEAPRKGRGGPPSP